MCLFLTCLEAVLSFHISVDNVVTTRSFKSFYKISYVKYIED